jgi:hypothetical protein
MSTRDAVACFEAFASVSEATKYAADSTASGRRCGVLLDAAEDNGYT